MGERETVNFTPNDNHVLVKVQKEEEKKGLLIVPNEKFEYQTGKVIACGVLTESSLDLEPDDIILFWNDAGTKLFIEGEEYLILSTLSVYGVFWT